MGATAATAAGERRLGGLWGNNISSRIIGGASEPEWFE
jgi:hypothetical protein